ncbi:MAG: hypothetical protein ACO1SV_00960 [Fimbriimonas sp.]
MTANPLDHPSLFRRGASYLAFLAFLVGSGVFLPPKRVRQTYAWIRRKDRAFRGGRIPEMPNAE